MDEATKIQHFKQGIISEVKLHSAVSITLIRSDLRSVVDLLSNFLATEVNTTVNRTTQLNYFRNKQVSAYKNTRGFCNGGKEHDGKSDAQRWADRPSKKVYENPVYSAQYSKVTFEKLTLK